MTTAAASNPASSPASWLRMIVAFTALILLGPLLGFLGAGTWGWGGGWVGLALLLGGTAISRIVVHRVHPDLIRERGGSLDRRDAPPFEKVLVPVIALFGPLVTWVVAGLDRRVGAPDPFAGWPFWLGIALCVLSFVFGTWALLANRFFSGVVRIQSEREHHVVDGGPYAFVRHPGYSASLPFYVGICLVLGSAWALVPSLLTFLVLVVRTALEDRFLHESLPGYPEYARRVRYRLLPGVW